MKRYARLRLARDRGALEPVTEVNIIPVIDISLVLLVILFVTAPLMSYPNLPIELPRASAEEEEGRTVTLSCTREERLAVASVELGWEGLGAALASELARAPDATVILRADKSVPYRTIQRLIAAAQDAGARRISLAAEKYP